MKDGHNRPGFMDSERKECVEPGAGSPSREERIRKCHELKATHSCSQAVALAFSDLTGLDDAILTRATIGFSSGMCTTEGTCGALTAAAMVCGLCLPGQEARKATANIMKGFRKLNGSTICHEIKGIDTGKALRSCPGCCADAACLLATELGE